MDVGVQGSKDEFSSYTRGIGRGIELVEETLVPGVDRVLEDLL
jgi:hypothetical protein